MTGAVLRGLGVANRLQAVVAARRLGLLAEPYCAPAHAGDGTLARQAERRWDELGALAERPAGER